ncbi:DUF2188 domain-containing protein [Oerskovia enterophila]|uniref:DUF2188 domain-containing protein n=1 Tax=Oerskovia enterophila TaxID=43678 RepID=UPI0033995044
MTTIETFHEDNIWKNRRQGDSVAFAVFDTKAEAVAAGREVAIREGAEHVIKNLDGRIAEKNSYGNDPGTIPG